MRYDRFLKAMTLYRKVTDFMAISESDEVVIIGKHFETATGTVDKMMVTEPYKEIEVKITADLKREFNEYLNSEIEKHNDELVDILQKG